MFQLTYRNSFIDVEEVSKRSVRTGRASSAPPLANRAAEWTPAQQEEAEMQVYVCSLFFGGCGSLASLSTTGSSLSTTGSDVTQADFDADAQAPSSGSLGHPELCRRACIYLAAGECKSGSACNYCHMDHVEKAPKLDKGQRGIMQQLSRRELLALVLPYCRTKAQELGSLADELLERLEEGAAECPPMPAWILERDVRVGLGHMRGLSGNLTKSLRRMNLSNLIGLATHMGTARTEDAAASVQLVADAFSALRLE
ncbi:unnamed protein product [Effrenium voratum]|nr:unnamed protein product [Effrenium voratum]